jgi:hypothetical protein
LNSVGLKTFLYGEAAFHPSLRSQGSNNLLNQLLKDTRYSLGFGLAIPLNPMISILVYYNALNFNSAKVGDIERRGYLNVHIGFF